MMNHTTNNVLLTVVFLLALPSKHRPMVVTASENSNNHDSTSTLTDSKVATTSSLRRLRQKMVYIPDLFEITPIQDRTLTTTSTSEWYDANRGDVTRNEKQQKHLPALFNKYRRHLPLSTIHTSAKKYNKENLLLEMEIFERLLQDEYSMSLSMPTQPIAPTPVIITPPTAPTPTIITPPVAPSPVVVPTVITTPTTPTLPTPIVPPTPVVVVPSSIPAPQSISPVTAPSTKGKAPNGMMSSSKSSAPSASKGAAPSVPTNVVIPTTPVSKSMVPSSKGGVEAPSSKGGAEAPSSKGGVEAPSSKGGVEAPSSKGGPSSKEQSSPPSSKGMNEPTSKGQPSSPSSKGGAPSTPEPTPLLSSKGGPSTSSPFGSMSGTPTVPGVTPTSDTTPTAPGATPLAPASTPTASSPTIFEGEGSLAPGGSETSNRGALILSKCGVSESDRSQAILGDASTISPLSELVDETSIAYTALSWLDKEDELILCSDGTGAVMQRYILAVFYFSLNGFEWTNCRAGTSEVAGSCIDGKPWLDSSHECEWYGIECDTNSTVTKLTLKANNLVGVLPDELFFLTSLIGLSLDHNMYIGGEISESIGKLTKLTYIELDENFLGGSIPESLYSISTLQAIDLNGNKLMGTISESIANLPSLAVFQIEDNLFEGALPIGLASLEELLVLYVHGNNFTGTSLQHICALMGSRRKTNVAYLQFLTADCKDSGKVECTCCDCF